MIRSASNQNFRILVTAVGSFSADIVIKELKRMGHYVVGCDVYPSEWLADAHQVDAFYQMPFANAGSDYLKVIKEIVLTEKVNLLIPLIDVEIDILNKNRDWFEERGVCLCISPAASIKLCRNKLEMSRFLCGRGNICIIPTTLLSNVDENKQSFPIVCKPYNGRSSQGMHIIQTLADLKYFRTQMKDENYIVQPYISGVIVTVDIVRQRENNRVVAIARKELLRTLNGAGTSVYVFYDAALQDICIKLAELLDVEGCVNFEFILDAFGNYHFLECNPRFAGGVEFSCIAGYNCIENHMRCFIGKDIEDFNLKHHYYIARKYEAYVTKTE